MNESTTTNEELLILVKGALERLTDTRFDELYPEGHMSILGKAMQQILSRMSPCTPAQDFRIYWMQACTTAASKYAILVDCLRTIDWCWDEPMIELRDKLVALCKEHHVRIEYKGSE